MGDRVMVRHGNEGHTSRSHYQPNLHSAMHTPGRAALHNILRASRIQAKLTIGAPDDVYEKEADRVADQVMRMSDNSRANQSELGTDQPASGIVQRACAGCEEEEMLQTKPLDHSQASAIKPTVIQRLCTSCEEEEMLQTKPLSESITPLVQRKNSSAESADSSGSSGSFESGLSSIKGRGRSLSQSERSFFEPRFGADFSHVRLHQDGQAAQLAENVSARAFTLGNDIVFGRGEYQSQSNQSKHLLAHELTHVIQQGSSEGQGIQRKSLQEAANVFDRACSCGEALANNCAHYLSDAMIDAGYTELDGGVGGMYRRRNGFVVCKHGRPVRAKEMRDWFADEGTVENSETKPDGYYAVYQQRDRDGQGHVTIKQCAGGTCTQPGNTWGFGGRDWETYYSF